MPRRSKRHNKGKSRRHKKTRHTKKQSIYNMIGCNHKPKVSCQNCGPNCHCLNCKCPKGCPGNCYLGRQLNKTKRRKFRGGSQCGSNGCPIAPLSWSQMQKVGGSNLYTNVLKGEPILGIGQNGGSFYKPAGPIPGPFIGQPWTANSWPGQNGVSNDNNYLASYKDVVANDPSYHQSMNDAGYRTMNSMMGGYRYDNKKERITSNSNLSSNKSRSSSVKGGGLIPQDLVNLGRDISFNVNSAYNALNGYKAPVNPLPYVQQPK